MKTDSESWAVYMIEASDHTLYTGIAKDVERRFEEHRTGKKGAKYFNGRKPLKIVYQETGYNRSSASQREYEIKRLSRGEKILLIASAAKQ